MLQLDSPAPKRVALVVGNGAYTQFNPLANTVSDARAMASTLRSLQFEVIEAIDADFRTLDERVGEFTNRLSAGSVALFYAASHGVQVDGENYIIPTDFAGKDKYDLKARALQVSAVLGRMQDRQTSMNIVILDACRNNPFNASRSGDRGLAPMNAGARGTFIAFATAPGEVASDSNPRTPGSTHGLFTEFLLQAMSACGWSLSQVFDYTRDQVDRASGSKQTPYTTSGVVGTFRFRPASTGCRASEPLPTLPPPLPPPSNPRQLRTAASLVGTWEGQYWCETGSGTTQYKISSQSGRLQVIESFHRDGLLALAFNGTVSYQAQWDGQAGKLRLATQQYGGYGLVFELSPDGQQMAGTYIRHPSGCVNVKLRRAN